MLKNYSLKLKILITAGLISLMPLITMAEDKPVATSTPTKAEVEAAKKQEKKDEISKQVADTINTSSALVSKIQDLEGRVTDRVSILSASSSLSQEAQNKIAAKQKTLDDILTSANDIINNILPKQGTALVNASKPAKALKIFKDEVGKVKAEIIDAHKVLLDIIDLIKKEAKVETSQDGGDNTATSSDATASSTVDDSSSN